MEVENLISYLDTNSSKSLNEETLKEFSQILDEYPYFQTIQLLYLKNLEVSSSPEYTEQLSKTALVCSDRKQLFYWIKSPRFQSFFPKKQTFNPSQRTEKLLDSFLDNLHTDSRREQIPETPDSISIISTDYIEYLEKAEKKTLSIEPADQKTLLKHNDIIDSFLEKADSGEISISLPEVDNEEEDESADLDASSGFLTETLARIYIKQKKYEQALEIIKRLSLNFPKKSVYFADQIRFLEHVILNEKNKKQ